MMFYFVQLRDRVVVYGRQVAPLEWRGDQAWARQWGKQVCVTERPAPQIIFTEEEED